MKLDRDQLQKQIQQMQKPETSMWRGPGQGHDRRWPMGLRARHLCSRATAAFWIPSGVCMCQETCSHGSKRLPSVLKHPWFKNLKYNFYNFISLAKCSWALCPRILKGFYEWKEFIFNAWCSSQDDFDYFGKKKKAAMVIFFKLRNEWIVPGMYCSSLCMKRMSW